MKAHHTPPRPACRQPFRPRAASLAVARINNRSWIGWSYWTRRGGGFRDGRLSFLDTTHHACHARFASGWKKTRTRV